MNNYVQLMRKNESTPDWSRGSGDVSRSPQPALAAALNRSAAVQAQSRIGGSLNQSPRVIAQAKLSQQVSDRSRGATMQMMRRPGRLPNLQFSYTRNQGPVQLWGWRDWVPSWDTAKDYASRGIGAAIGGATAGYLAGTSGVLGMTAMGVGGAAGLAIGAPAAATAAGLALGGYGGWRAGAAAMSYLGGVAAPYLGEAAAAYMGGAAGSVVGGLAGERVGMTVANALPGKAATSSDPVPLLATVMYRRMRERNESAFKYLPRSEHQRLRHHLNTNADPHRVAIAVLRDSYAPQTAAPNQYAADTDRNAALSTILRANPFIQRVLSGALHATIGQPKRHDPHRGNLNFHRRVKRRKVPAVAKAAKEIFNELVSIDMSNHPIGNVKKNSWLDPVSSMTNSGIVNVGHPVTRGILLHELGHHLENSLTPLEIGSLHNFLRARSRHQNLRKVGYERLVGLPGDSLGYDTEGPDMSGTTASKLAVSSVVNLTHLGTGVGIDEFFRGRANDSTGSYATKVYGGSSGMRTEFLSTTIHYFDDPSSAEELVAKDPLRVCLFLSLARPHDYALVRAQFDALPNVGRTLDQRIHKIT